MRNSLKILLLNVIPPEQTSFQRGVGHFIHTIRKAFENFLTDTLSLGGYFVEVVGKAKEPACQSLTDLDRRIRQFNQRTDRFMAIVAGGIVLLALLY